MGTLYIGSRSADPAVSLSDRGLDKLNAAKLDAIPGPILARFFGSKWEWEVIDFEVECALVRINVCGLSEVKGFCEIAEMTDIDGQKYDPEDFWND